MGSLSNIQIEMPKRIPMKLIAGIIAFAAIAFFFFINKSQVPEIEKEISKITTNIEMLEVKENNLATLYNSMEYYLDETDRLYKDTEEILTEFPTFMYLEDKILYADTLLKETELRYYNLSGFEYGQSNYIMNATYGSEEKMLELYSVALSSKYIDITYAEAKKILNFGLTADQRFVVNQITMTYDEKTGYISGELSFTTYFVPGQTTPYEFPPEVIEGLGNSNRIDDLFGARTDRPVSDSNQNTQNPTQP